MEIRLLIACATTRDAASLQLKLRDGGAGAGIACATAALSDACRVAGAARPDVAMLDLDPGLQLLPFLAQASPGTRALLMNDREASTGEIVEALRRGAAGWIHRAVDALLLAKAVRTVFAGGTWFGRTALVEALRTQIGLEIPTQINAQALTHREEEILQLIGQGLSNKEIGRRLEISEHTVKTHLHRVYSKLHQSGRYKAFLAQPCAAPAPVFRNGIPHPRRTAADRP